MTGKDVMDVLARLKTDPSFSAQLKADAEAAALKGVGSPEHMKLMSHFVTSSSGLSAMPGPQSMPPICWTTTTTLSTEVCTTTTTTTTWV